MKKIFLLMMAVGLIAPLTMRAQDAATDERLNKLSGYIEELQKSDVQRQKDLMDMRKQLEEFRQGQGKVEAQYATQDDIKKLTDKLMEIDRKRIDDNEKILKEIQKIVKLSTAAASRPVVNDTPTSNGAAEKGFEYTIAPGDTLSTIIQAYRDKNIKVTLDSILKANPNLKPTSMKVGEKIWIPAP
jgi:TolA-binding protein